MAVDTVHMEGIHMLNFLVILFSISLTLINFGSQFIPILNNVLVIAHLKGLGLSKNSNNIYLLSFLDILHKRGLSYVL